jgi:hypothetical protein
MITGVPQASCQAARSSITRRRIATGGSPVIRDYISAVTVHRAKPGTKGFDRGRVAIARR